MTFLILRFQLLDWPRGICIQSPYRIKQSVHKLNCTVLKKWKKSEKTIRYIWKAKIPGLFDFKEILLQSTRFFKDYLYFRIRISKNVDFRILKQQKLYYFHMIQSSIYKLPSLFMTRFLILLHISLTYVLFFNQAPAHLKYIDKTTVRVHNNCYFEIWIFNLHDHFGLNHSKIGRSRVVESSLSEIKAVFWN